MPVGVFSTTEGTTGRLVAVVLDETGARRLEVTHEGPLADPQELGESVARALIDAGADSILSTVEKRYLGQPTNRPRGPEPWLEIVLKYWRLLVISIPCAPLLPRAPMRFISASTASTRATARPI